ncbi:MAG: hypothetical protein FGM54_08080 [Chitinophagaceae bacterium]|nr:hypothetical protein [Chitinophagaceae bacterium]
MRLGASLLGLIAGGFLNGGIINISSKLIPPPLGVNPNSIESIKANIHLYEPKHFAMPFLAHALGTLVGAFIATRLGDRISIFPALLIGAFFLYGGYTMVKLLPGAPMWFNVLDLTMAYIPMAILGWWLGRKKILATPV